MRELFIVIPVHNRREMLWSLLNTLNYDPEHVILVDNNSVPPLDNDFGGVGVILTRPERNIQYLWNQGWAEAESRANGPYAIAFLNSDAWTTMGSLETMSDALDSLNASVVGTDHCTTLMPGGHIRKRIPGPVEWARRMSGWGFVVRGELQSRFDEQFVWWYGDDDFEWRARQEFGGAIILGGSFIANRDANGAIGTYPELVSQTDQDRVAFINKWGTSSQDWTIYNIAVYNAKLSKYRSMM